MILVRMARVDFSVASPAEFVQAFWFMMHEAFSDGFDESGLTQLRGVFILNNLHGATRANFNKDFTRQNLFTMQEILPIRVSAVRIVHQPW